MTRTGSAGFALVRAAVLASVALVPLLIDPANTGDPFYAVKAHAIQALAAVTVLGFILIGDRGVRRLHLPWRPLSAFMAAAAIATVLAINPRWSLEGAPWRHEGLLTLLSYALLCAGTAAVISGGEERSWTAAVLLGSGLVALLGIAQVLGWDGLPRDLARASWQGAYSTSGNPGWLGAYVVLVTPLAAAACARAEPRSLRVAGALILPVLILAGLLTFSRITWALVIFSIPVWLARFPRTSERRALRAVVPAAFFLVTVLMIWGPARSGVAARIGDLLDPRAGPVQERRFLWTQTVQLLGRRPLLGYGPEALPLVFPQAWTEAKRQIFGDEPLVIDKAHNETLDMATSVGLLGLAAFFWLVAVSMHGAWGKSGLGAACLIGAAGYLLHLQVNFSVVSVAPVFWSVLGAAYGLGGRGPGSGAPGGGPGGAGASTVKAEAKPP